MSRVEEALEQYRSDESQPFSMNYPSDVGHMLILADAYVKLRSTEPITEEFAAKVSAIEGWSLYRPSASRDEWFILVRMRNDDDHTFYVDAKAPNQGFVHALLLAAGIECDV